MMDGPNIPATGTEAAPGSYPAALPSIYIFDRKYATFFALCQSYKQPSGQNHPISHIFVVLIFFQIMLLKVHPENPSPRQILKACEVLQKGGVLVYPTDTVYAFGCDIYNTRAVERIARLKGTRVDKADFSFIFSDLSQLSDYTRLVSNSVFKMMKAYLPGPYTFILPARNNIPRIFHSRKKTIGIRIPANNIPVEIVRELGHPIMTTSIHDEDELIEYTTDPELIWEKYRDQIDALINGGYGKNEASTVIDCTNEEPVVLRQGIGTVD